MYPLHQEFGVLKWNIHITKKWNSWNGRISSQVKYHLKYEITYLENLVRLNSLERFYFLKKQKWEEDCFCYYIDKHWVLLLRSKLKGRCFLLSSMLVLVFCFWVCGFFCNSKTGRKPGQLHRTGMSVAMLPVWLHIRGRGEGFPLSFTYLWNGFSACWLTEPNVIQISFQSWLKQATSTYAYPITMTSNNCYPLPIPVSPRGLLFSSVY